MAGAAAETGPTLSPSRWFVDQRRRAQQGRARSGEAQRGGRGGHTTAAANGVFDTTPRTEEEPELHLVGMQEAWEAREALALRVRAAEEALEAATERFAEEEWEESESQTEPSEDEEHGPSNGGSSVSQQELLFWQAVAWTMEEAQAHAEQSLVTHQEDAPSTSPERRGLEGAWLSMLPVAEWSCAREKEECSICLQDLAVGERVMRLPCFHQSHEECLVKWLAQSPHCPVCKWDVRESVSHTLDM